MNKSLTIVLPVYNCEMRLRKSVTELLELASELTPKFGVLIIDDGSTDATFEVAEDLAANYPQVLVHRHRQRRGLGAMIEYAQRRVRSDAVMIHDGVTPVNPQQMRSVWQNWVAHSAAGATAAVGPHSSMQEIAGLTAVHGSLERVHRRVLGFQLISSHLADAEHTPKPAMKTTATFAGSDLPPGRAKGVGGIPPLPRPKFLSALASFAFGE